MDTLIFALNAVLPILLLIGLGYILKKLNFLNETFLQIGNKFVFRIALPALLFYTIYNIESFETINWSIIIYAVIATFLLFGVGVLIAIIFIKDDKQKGSIIQGIFRPNYAIIGIPLAYAIGGDEAVINVALISAVVVPLVNILAVIALTVFVRGESDTHHFKSTLVKIIKNPLILSILLGLIFLFVRSYIPINPETGELVFSLKNNFKFLYTSIKWLKEMASPLALIVLGGTFEFLATKHMFKEITIGVFSRIVLAPLLTLPIAVLLSRHVEFFSFTAFEFAALIPLFGSPTAVSGAIMAKEMGSDEKLSVQLVVWTTSLSIISIFIIVFIFRCLGLI